MRLLVVSRTHLEYQEFKDKYFKHMTVAEVTWVPGKDERDAWNRACRILWGTPYIIISGEISPAFALRFTRLELYKKDKDNDSTETRSQTQEG